MDIEYLRLFICLAENRSFTNAAKQLYMSSSSFSNKISELEREIGVKLVERTTRSVALTEAGEYFLSESKSLMQRYSGLAMRTREIANGNAGTLSVGYLDLIGMDIVETIIVDYCGQHPNVDVQLRKRSFPELYRGVGEMDIDVAFLTTNEFADTVPVVSEPVMSARMKVLLNKEHPLAAKKMLKISDLKDEPLIIVENSQSKAVMETVSDMFARQGMVLNVVRECAGPEELTMYVSCGQGVGIVSNFFSRALRRSERVTLRPLSHIMDTRTLYVIHHTGNANRCVQPFLETVRASAKQIIQMNEEYLTPEGF